MKKFLPKSVNNPQGFTLIELLVVISIIAILAVVGFVAYSGVSARGRDTKRIAEIDAIQKAMEKNYQPAAAKPYPALAAGDFANGEIPTDPVGTDTGCSGTVCKYCSRSVAAGVCVTTDASVSAYAAGTTYIFCANLETKAGKGGATYYCKSNAQ